MLLVVPADSLLRFWALALLGSAAGLHCYNGIGEAGYLFPDVMQRGRRRAAGDFWL